MKKATTGIKDKKSLLQLDLEGLSSELKKTKKEFYVLKMKHFSNELKQTHLLKLHRRAIARLQTLIKESEQKI